MNRYGKVNATIVMPALVAGSQVFLVIQKAKTWMVETTARSRASITRLKRA
jgi:hypothetical protein